MVETPPPPSPCPWENVPEETVVEIGSLLWQLGVLIEKERKEQGGGEKEEEKGEEGEQDVEQKSDE